VAKRISELLGREVPLARDWTEGVQVKPGSLVLLENCRFNKGEKKDDEALARKYAALCDVYVNDAFGTAHRAEASTHGVARFEKVACAGPLLANELDALGRALAKPARPLGAIVAGSKVSTKLTILKSLASKVDQLSCPLDNSRERIVMSKTKYTMTGIKMKAMKLSCEKFHTRPDPCKTRKLLYKLAKNSLLDGLRLRRRVCA
jgi:hypothetical protein